MLKLNGSLPPVGGSSSSFCFHYLVTYDLTCKARHKMTLVFFLFVVFVFVLEDRPG